MQLSSTLNNEIYPYKNNGKKYPNPYQLYFFYFLNKSFFSLRSAATLLVARTDSRDHTWQAVKDSLWCGIRRPYRQNQRSYDAET